MDQLSQLREWLWTDFVEEPAAWLGVILLIAITYLQFRQNNEFHQWEKNNSDRERERLEREAEDRKPRARVGLVIDGKVATQPVITVSKVTQLRKTPDEIDREVQEEFERIVQEFTGLGLDQYSLNRFRREHWDSEPVGNYMERYKTFLELENDRNSRWRFKFLFGVENYGKVTIHDINTDIQISEATLAVLEEEDEQLLKLQSNRPNPPKRRTQMEANRGNFGFGYRLPDINTYIPPTTASEDRAWRSDDRVLANDFVESDLIFAVCPTNADNVVELTYSVHAAEMTEAQTGVVKIQIREVEDFEMPTFFDEE